VKKSVNLSNLILHIPYSGFGNPYYVSYEDFKKDSVCALILEIIDYGHPETEPISSIQDLRNAWENLDYNSTWICDVSLVFFAQRFLTELKIYSGTRKLSFGKQLFQKSYSSGLIFQNAFL